MKAFIDLTESVQSFFAVWYGVLMLVSVFLMLRLLFRKSFKKGIPCILLFAVEYMVLQSIFMLSSYYESGKQLDAFTRFFTALPWLWVAALAFVLTLFQLIAVYRVNAWHKTHVTERSVKEGLDELPMALCWYRESGFITMKNRAMEALYTSLAHQTLTNGRLLEESLLSSARELSSGDGVTRFMMTTGEGENERHYSVTLRSLKADLPYRELLVLDVTEEYEKTRLLNEKKLQVEALNERLSLYSREIVDTITAQEILAAKIKIHDQLGQLLLTSRKYLLRGGTSEEKEHLMTQLKTNLELMEHGENKNRRDHLEMLVEAAADMGIRLLIEGALPEDETRREILLTAIHENLTNTIRHAQGDALSVKLRPVEGSNRLRAIFENNGIVPEGTVEEKGGLKSLRRLVEDAGGTMNITVDTRFRMEIEL